MIIMFGVLPRTCILLLLQVVVISTTVEGEDKNQQHDDWIDPFDMVNFDHSTKTMRTTKKEVKHEDDSEPSLKHDPVMNKPVPEHTTTTMPTPVEPLPNTEQEKIILKKKENNSTCKKDDVGSVVLKKFLKQLVYQLQGKYPVYASSLEYNIWVHLTLGQIQNLEKFGNTKEISVHDVDEILSSMIQSITVSDRDTKQKTSMWFEDKFGITLDGFIKVLALGTLATFLTWLEVNLQLSVKQRVTKLFILAFIISIPMTYYELYKAAEIQQQTVAMKDAPANCVQNDDKTSWFKMIKGVFSFEKDECQEYYEHMMIDPLLKVTPTKAVAITFVRFFISPLKDIGGALSEFLRALFKDLPVTFYPVAVTVLSIVLFLFLFMWFGYSIRLPFFLGSVEPTYNVAVTDSYLREAIENQAKQLTEQMKSLQDIVMNTDQTLTDRMHHLENVQKAAIEYTAATSVGSTAPPTLPVHQKTSHLHETSQNMTALKQISLPSGSSFTDNIVEARNKQTKSPIPCTESTDSIEIISSSELLCNDSQTGSYVNVTEENLDISQRQNERSLIETLQPLNSPLPS